MVRTDPEVMMVETKSPVPVLMGAVMLLVALVVAVGLLTPDDPCRGTYGVFQSESCIARGRAGILRWHCEQAKEEWDRPVDEIVGSIPTSWGPIAEFVAEVEFCAMSQRSETAAMLAAHDLDSCDRVDLDEVRSNPLALVGACRWMYVYITGIDAADSDACVFEASVAETYSTSTSDYETEVIFSMPDPCSEVAGGIDSYEFRRVWAIGTGTSNRNADLGLLSTTPAFDARIVIIDH